jgi:hypothetical protein
MANRYYPEFYLRKRQRESAYKRVTWGLGILLLVAAGVFTGYLIYKNVLEPRKTQPGVTSDLANERTDLTTDAKLANLNSQPTAAGDAQQSQAAPSLDQVPYGESMPLVNVGVDAGGASTAPATAATDGQAGTPAVTDQTAPATADTTPPAADSTPPAAPGADTTPAVQPPTPVVPKPDTAVRKPADKPKDKPQDKPKDKPKDQPKPAVKPVEAAKPDAQPAAKGSTFVYRVYAGSFSSEEAAQQRKGELKSLGFSGTVSKGFGEYNLFVAELDDLADAAALAKKLKASGFSAAYSTRAKKSK